MKGFAIFALAAVLLPAQFAEPWTPADLLAPEALAAVLKNTKSPPLILYVGFPVLYRSAHIPGAIMAGPGGRAEGLEALKKALEGVPRNRQVVLYCGCCPWNVCPNVRPAFKLVRELGFGQAKLLTIPENMHTDWISKGYPIERPAGQGPKLQ